MDTVVVEKWFVPNNDPNPINDAIRQLIDDLSWQWGVE